MMQVVVIMGPLPISMLVLASMWALNKTPPALAPLLACTQVANFNDSSTANAFHVTNGMHNSC
jgi:hypothetical protein